MVAMFRPQPDATAITQPKPAPLGLLAGSLQTFFTPNPLYPLVIDLNALVPEHVRNHPIPRATVSGGQLYDLCADLILVCALDHPIPYGGSIHP
jgi:hypothetical protein